MMHWTSVIRVAANTIRSRSLRRLTLAAVAIAALVAVRDLPPDHRLHVWIDVLAGKGETVVASVVGESTVLHFRAWRTIASMEREIDRLQWIEAESSVKATQVGATVGTLDLHADELRNVIEWITALLANGADQYDIAGTQVTAGQLRSHAEELITEWDALQEQRDLYQRAADMYVQTEREARSLKQQMMQSMQRTTAYLALLEATETWTGAQYENGTTRFGSGAGSALTKAASELEAEIERNQQIIEMRKRLEDFLAQDVPPSPPFGPQPQGENEPVGDSSEPPGSSAPGISGLSPRPSRLQLGHHMPAET